MNLLLGDSVRNRIMRTQSWSPFQDDDDDDDDDVEDSQQGVDDDDAEAASTIHENHAETTTTITTTDKALSSKLRLRLRLGYGCGHAQNDLCSAMYFSYLLVFLELVGLSPVDGGIVLIVGQLVDGLATPVVGSLSDQISCTCCRSNFCLLGLAGRRNSWYLAGIVLVSSTFWMLFTPYPQGIPPVIYYSIANGLFQVGWATVQVTTMTIVTELTPLLSERTVLNSIRFAVTVGTSITVYVLVWVFSAVTSSSSNEGVVASGNNSEVSEEANETSDGQKLMLSLQSISYIVLLTGALLSILYLCLVREKDDDGAAKRLSLASCLESDEDKEREPDKSPAKSIRDWFLRTRGFYGVLSNYTVTRVCVNSLQVYLPFFAIYNMPDNASGVATVPLITFVGMCLSSLLAPRISFHLTDAAKQYVVGTVCLIVGAVILFLLSGTSDILVFVASALLGIGSALLMVTSQTLVGELVGHDSNGGIVFGINALGDKVSTGIVIFAIQRSAEHIMKEDGLADLYRFTASCVPAVCAALGLLSLVTVPRNIRDRHKFEEDLENDETDQFDTSSSWDSVESNQVL